MEQYVALFYRSGELGRTILCGSLNEALVQAMMLVQQQGIALSGEQIEEFQIRGDLILKDGAIHVGQLEPPMDEE